MALKEFASQFITPTRTLLIEIFSGLKALRQVLIVVHRKRRMIYSIQEEKTCKGLDIIISLDMLLAG
jgi:hypothetical protein